MRIIKKIKKKYNKWLFQKYGYSKDKIPAAFTHNRMFSPSLYHREAGQVIVTNFQLGLEHTNEQIGKAIQKALVEDVSPRAIAEIAGQVFGFAVAEDLEIKGDYEAGEKKNI